MDTERCAAAISAIVFPFVVDAKRCAAAISASILLLVVDAECGATTVSAFIPLPVVDAVRGATTDSASILRNLVDAPLGRHRCWVVLSAGKMIDHLFFTLIGPLSLAVVFRRSFLSIISVYPREVSQNAAISSQSSGGILYSCL